LTTMIPFQLHHRIPLVRRPFFQRDQAIAERDSVVAQRDAVAAERDAVAAQRNAVAAERDLVAAERDQLASERDRIAAERDGIAAERDRALAQRDQLAAELDRVRFERDRIAAAANFQTGTPKTALFDAARKSFSTEAGTKHPGYYSRYDRFFHKNSFTPTSILEIGVHQGESTKVFATVYPHAKIVALDLDRHQHVDFSAFGNITYIGVDQTDTKRLEEVIKNEFPAGFDFVIEDASHIGAYSHITFHTVFPHLKPGGIYIVEDWGTGYFDDFVDGSRFQEYPLHFHDGNIPKRMPSHDFGMVGFVKSLVDMTSEPDIRNKMSDPPKHKPRIETLEFSEAICIAMKART
jgi:hypothetical protein